MSDLFHKDVPVEYIQKVFDVMRQAEQHHFQILTKRSQRLNELAIQLQWPNNVWMGVTVESQDYMSRIGDLKAVPAKVRFVSFEPLLGPIKDFNLDGIHWVIVGGESGPGSRPMEKAWVTDILDKCQESKVPFFFKQWGGRNKKAAGRTLNGQTWDEYPQFTKGRF